MKGNREWTYDKFIKYLKEGRGQGELQDYIPWIKVYDFSSKGYSIRVPGIKTNRIHHFLSNLEYHYFLILSYSKKVIDIREQFPLLNYKRTMEIAKEKGIKYPTSAKIKAPYIFTTDFLVTVKDDNGIRVIARTIKLSEKIKKKRVLEKLEIERIYWHERDVDWAIVTEKELGNQQIINLKLLYYANLVASQKFSPLILKRLTLDMYYRLSDSKQSLYLELQDFEKEFSLEYGGGLTLFYYMVFNHVINLEINRKIDVYTINCESLVFEGDGAIL